MNSIQTLHETFSPGKSIISNDNYRNTYRLFSLLYFAFILDIFFHGALKYLIFSLICIIAIHLMLNFAPKNSKTQVDFFLFLAGLFLSIHGYLNKNFSSYLIVDIIFFLLSSLILFNRNVNSWENFTSKFPNIVAFWLIPGTLLSWYIIFKIGLQPSEIGTRIVREEEIEGEFASFDIVSPLYPALLIAPFFKFINGEKRIFVTLAVMTFFIFSLFTATRGGIIASIIAAVFIVGSLKKSSKKSLNVISFSFLITLVSIFIVNQYGADSLEKAYENIVFRFFDSEEFDSGRGEEEELFLESLTFEEWLIGRGFGGANYSWIWSDLANGMNIVHKGYLYLILKGGLLFAILVYGVGLVSIFKLYKKGKEYTPFIYCILLFFLLDQGHTQWLNLFPCLFFWLSVSMAFNKNLKTS